MQKKLIALAVAGLVSGAAFAQTSVTIGGKFDAGYQFKRTSDKDTASKVDPESGENVGGKTTETLGDGAASTSRITIVAKEVISPNLEAGVNLDLRFGTIEECKGTAQDATQKNTCTGGITTNDKKLAYLKTLVGTVQWGVINLGDNFYLASKPYMVEPKDLEIVKYGIATYRYTALTSRVSEYITPTLNMGPVGLLAKGQYAFGDKRKDGSSNVDNAASGDAFSGGMEWKIGSVVNGGFDWNYRATTNNDTSKSTVYTLDSGKSTATAKANDTYAGADSWRMYRVYASVFPVGGLKLAATYVNQNGYGADSAGVKTGFQDKITNFVVSYNFGGTAEIGAEYSVVRDVGENRNSGHGLMIGGAYFLSKSAYLYAAFQKTDWERNEKGAVGGKFDGTATNFTGNADKLDARYTRVGFVKEF